MSWDKYFLNICNAVATNSKCASRKVGAIIVRDNRIISTGYNGPPSGIRECWKRFSSGLGFEQLERAIYFEEELCPRQLRGFGSSEGLEYCVASHGEVNVIVTAARMGVSVKEATLFCNCNIPCKSCTGYIINAGIGEVVCVTFEEYQKEISSMDLLMEAGVKIRLYNEA